MHGHCAKFGERMARASVESFDLDVVGFDDLT
jgi:hypothetical protein